MTDPTTAAPTRFAISLDLTGRRVLVVGGGPVCARRCRDLVAAGARTEVVSPWLCEDLVDLAERGAVVWHEREARPGDVTGPDRAWLVHTATGDVEVDAAVAAEAHSAGVWCIRAGEADRSPAWRPAVAVGPVGGPAEDVVVAVTAGGDPRRARAIRDAVLAGLESGTLPVRRLRPDRRDSRAGARRTGRAPTGTVALVGGGPGDDGLLTVRGRALLAAADVVVADRLGPRGVLDRLGPDVEIIDVGKTPGHHPVPQHQINALLVEHARRGRAVVRLKGGDPFVLGRGGEEAQHCAEHGVPVEVVPGVTSAISVPAAAGIPVTHRGLTQSVVVASGHDGAPAVLAATAAAPPDATVVLLMAVARLGEIARGLVHAGRPGTTPVAVIEGGWTCRQRTTTGTLADIEERCHLAAVRPPAVVVIGAVVALRARLGDLTARREPA